MSTDSTIHSATNQRGDLRTANGISHDVDPAMNSTDRVTTPHDELAKHQGKDLLKTAQQLYDQSQATLREAQALRQIRVQFQVVL